MTMKAMILAAVMGGTAFASSAQAADISYQGSDRQDNVDVSYSITTNGKLGVLSLDDILASSITFTGSAASRYGAFSPFTAVNNVYFSNTDAGGVSPVSATATGLVFDFGNGGGLNFGTYDCDAINGNCYAGTAPNDAVAGLVYALAAKGINDGDAVVYEHNGRATKELDNPDRSNYRLAEGTYTEVEPTSQVFADAVVAAAVPEPTSWALMIAGFGIAGFGLRRRSGVATRVAYAV